jgi:hypothetical protein
MKSAHRVLSSLALLAAVLPAAAQPPASCTLTQVTSSATRDSFAGGLSADGRFLGLTSKADHTAENPDGSRELFLYDRVRDELHQLTHYDHPDALVHDPTVSADGSRVFFLSNVHPETGALLPLGELALASVARTSGEAILHARHVEDAAVSADGARAVLLTREDPTGGNPDASTEVFLLDVATGDFLQITDTTHVPCSPFGTCPGQFEPQIDADGSHVAFVSDLDPIGSPGTGGWGGVYLYDVAAGSLSEVVLHADPGLVLSGDAGALAFPSFEDLTGENPEGLTRLFVYEVGAGTLRQVSRQNLFLSRVAALDRSGARLAFNAAPTPGLGRDAFLYQSGPGGSAVVAPLMANPGVDDFAAAMTPDGTWVSLHSKAKVQGGNADGSFEVHLALCGQAVAPPPPPGDWLTTAEVPGFRVKARITAGGEEQPVRAEPVCIPETLCVSGALPGRSELFVRVIGPRPNGKLWPVLVRFTTSTVEVWIEQLASGDLQYYRLEGASPGSSDLTGFFDRAGFTP